MKKVTVIILMFFAMKAYSQYMPSPSFFRTQRASPLVDLQTTTSIFVANYGAVINDGIDDRVAIQNAIDAAENIGTLANPVRLVFQTGTYDLFPDPNSSHSLEMIDANGVLWDGQNAEFLIRTPSVGFLSLLRCSNTVIKDFTVDYNTLPFTQGLISQVDTINGYFEFIVDTNFPLPTEAHFTAAPERWGMIKNSKGGIKKGTNNLIPHVAFFQLISGRTYRYNQNISILRTLSVGDYFVHMARYNGKTVIRNNGGKNLTYLNVTAHASPAGGFNAFNSEEWHILNSKVQLKANRVHTLNADGIHVNGGTIAPWVENCLFEGFADDCVNLKYIKRDIKTVHSSTQLTVVGNVIVGENIEFYNPRDGVFLGSSLVSAVQSLGSNLFKITLSSPINITNVTDPEHQLADKAYVESRCNESFIFRNNIVRNSRRYGILIQSKYALIENNLFQNLSSSGITIENGVDWGEGFRANEIEIKNNRFENCGHDSDYIQDSKSASIVVDFMKLGTPCNTSITWCGTQTTNFIAHSNIRILNNTILYNKRGLYLKNINGLQLTNNFICNSGEDISIPNNQAAIQQTILNSTNVTVNEYNYQLPVANAQFNLTENSINLSIGNSGTNTSVTLKEINRGGVITRAFPDNVIGYAVQMNTTGNGELRIVDKVTEASFLGPILGAARTYTFWIKPEQAIFQTLLYSGGPTNGEVFSVQMQANRVLRVTDSNSNFVRMDDMPLDIGVWNHISVTVPENGSISGISLYKNGIPSKETLVGLDVPILTSSNKIDFFPTFIGLVSDIRYFDRTLCSGEIQRVYNDRQIVTPLITEIYVSANGNNTTGDGTSVNPYLTINKAVDVAMSETKIIIVGTVAQAGQVAFNKSLTFEGRSNAVIRGDGANRLFNITAASGDTISFTNITFRNIVSTLQGAVLNSSTQAGMTFLFTNCNFLNNSTSSDEGRGAFYFGSNPTTVNLINCTFYNNAVVTSVAGNARGGAIHFNGNTTAQIKNCTFFGNKVARTANFDGAAIRVSTMGCNISVTNSLFYNNRASNGVGPYSDFNGISTSTMNILNSLAQFQLNSDLTTGSYFEASDYLASSNLTFDTILNKIIYIPPESIANKTPIDYGSDREDVGSYNSNINIFRGVTNSDWGTASNWSGTVPTTTDNVILLTDSPAAIIGPTTIATCSNLSLHGISSLTQALGGKLFVTGSTPLRNTIIYTTNSSSLRVVGLPLGITSLTLMDELGNQVMQTSFNSTGVNEISMPKLFSGSYILKLETKAGKLNKNIILE